MGKVTHSDALQEEEEHFGDRLENRQEPDEGGARLVFVGELRPVDDPHLETPEERVAAHSGERRLEVRTARTLLLAARHSPDVQQEVEHELDVLLQ